MKTTIKNLSKIVLVAIGLLSLTTSCSPEDGIDGANGVDGVNGINGVAIYYNPITITGLNNSAVNVLKTYTILDIGTKTFIKVDANTQVDIKLRSNINSGIFNGAAAIQFELLVDGIAGSASSNDWIYASNTIQSINLDSTFTGLSKGTHTITIRARTNNGTSTGVIVDSGNYGGKIIVQER